MKRVSRLKHHEVGYVNDIVYRAQADRQKFLLEPVRAFAYFNVLYHSSAISRAGAGVKDLDLNISGCSFGSFLKHDFRCPQLFIRHERELPAESQIAERVGSVGGHLKFEDDVFVAEKLFQRRSRVQTVIEDHNAFVIVRESELVFRAYHSDRFLAADLRFLDHEVLHLRALERYGHGLSGGHVRRAADYRQHCRPDIHLAQAQFVGVGMFYTFQNFTYDEIIEFSFNMFNAFALESEYSEPVNDIVYIIRVYFKIDIIFKPLCRNFHYDQIPLLFKTVQEISGRSR